MLYIILNLKVPFPCATDRPSTKTVYPTTDPEFSRKSSQSDPAVSSTKKDPERAVEPVLAIVDVSHSTERSNTSLSGRNVQEHSARVSTPPRDSCTPVDAEG